MFSHRREPDKRDNEKRGYAPDPRELKRQIDFLEAIVVTKEFQTATQNLIDNPHQLHEVTCAPRAYLKRFGVNVPEEVAVSVEGDPWFIFCYGNACVRVWCP